MMKKALVIVVALFGSLSFVQADIALSEGLRNVSADGHIDTSSFAGTEIALRGGYGVYIRNGIEVGGQVEFANNDFITRYAIAGYGEYNWDLDYFWVPFAGASLGIGGLDTFDESGDGFALELGLRGGIKYFVLDNLALTSSMGIGLSTGDTFDDGGSADAAEFRIDLGVKVFF